ncbi:hypothetical protein [Pontibacter actiniarum]|uniref:Uncharacterized protein n=1 Tax=Pontibacter actiniarum TaxID=323450 RepID=A0A1X9YZ42_9BACT|nr:hypothetical protein [Pontibacter actiniarum]ARS38148.1 hypothetical protein CA264_21630 [Pontibacter actiniarum]
MDIVAAILLFGAALVGVFSLTHSSMNMSPPPKLTYAHVGLAVAGYLALVIYAFVTEQPEKHYHTLIILGIAGLIGLWLLLTKKPVHTGAAIAYSLVGMFGFLWLLTFIIT